MSLLLSCKDISHLIEHNDSLENGYWCSCVPQEYINEKQDETWLFIRSYTDSYDNDIIHIEDIDDEKSETINERENIQYGRHTQWYHRRNFERCSPPAMSLKLRTKRMFITAESYTVNVEYVGAHRISGPVVGGSPTLGPEQRSVSGILLRERVFGGDHNMMGSLR